MCMNSLSTPVTVPAGAAVPAAGWEVAWGYSWTTANGIPPAPAAQPSGSGDRLQGRLEATF